MSHVVIIVASGVPFIKIIDVNNNCCNIDTLVDSGSPINIVKKSVYEQVLGNIDLQELEAHQLFKGNNNMPIETLGNLDSTLRIEGLGHRQLSGIFFVVNDQTMGHPMLLGR